MTTIGASTSIASDNGKIWLSTSYREFDSQYVDKISDDVELDPAIDSHNMDEGSFAPGRCPSVFLESRGQPSYRGVVNVVDAGG